jgi:hypothetical protein
VRDDLARHLVRLEVQGPARQVSPNFTSILENTVSTLLPSQRSARVQVAVLEHAEKGKVPAKCSVRLFVSGAGRGG